MNVKHCLDQSDEKTNKTILRFTQDPLTSLMNPVFDPSQLDSDHSLMTYSPIEFMPRTGAITPATSRCQSDAPAMLARTLSLPSQHGVTNDIWCRPHKPLTHAATLEQWRKVS